MSRNPTKSDPTGQGGRLYSIDALRSVLMFWGILVHVSTLDDTAFFRWSAQASGLFRMATFFMLGGILSAKVFAKSDPANFLGKRLKLLLIPFVFGVVLMNPLTNYLVYRFHNGPYPLVDFLLDGPPAGAHGTINWHLHLWFLIPMAVYALATRPFDRLCRGPLGRLGEGLSQLHPEWVHLIFAALAGFGVLLLRSAYELCLDPWLPEGAKFITRSTLVYAPFFAIGYFVSLKSRLLEKLSSFRVTTIVLLVACFSISPYLMGRNPTVWMTAGLALQRGLLAFALATTLLFLFGQIVRRSAPWLLWFSNASYTVYLVHYSFIFVLATLFKQFGWYGGATPYTVAALTFILTLAFHHGVVARSHWLSIALNGRPLKSH